MNAFKEESYIVSTWDTDSSAALTACGAFNLCQETAGRHAEELGVGVEEMISSGTFWILSRMSLVVDSRPLRGEKLIVKTWPRGSERLFARRDYELKRPDGSPVGRGRAGWLILDSASRRPRRPDALVARFPSNEGHDALSDGIRGLDPVDAAVPAARRSVAYSDLDYNKHMNNARYVQWAQDVLDADALAGASGFRVDINYLAEVTAGSVLDLYRASGPDGLERVEGRLVSAGDAAGAVSFRCDIRLL